MASHKIRYPKEYVLEKLRTRISKGKVIAEKGLEIVQNYPDRNKDRFSVDKFRTEYNQWFEVTNSVLLDIYESSNYAYNFRLEKSTEKKYVSTEWQPDIYYYITHELLPKLNYLKVLKDNIDDYIEIPAETNIEDPDKIKIITDEESITNDVKSEEIEISKVSILYLLKRISFPQLISFLGGIILIISGSFYFGYNVKSWQIDREKVELVHENESANSKIDALTKEIDSLKQVDSSFIKKNK